jgi:DNA-binding NarL/FixJ family response regulator
MEGMSDQIRIVLADDHAVVRAGIRQFLEREPDLTVVAEADDGARARDAIERHRPQVAVLDIQMPELSGIEVARWVRHHLPSTGILILTAYDDDPYVRAVLDAGANGYVLKTASPPDIVAAVRDVYEGRSVLDPAIAARVRDALRGRDEPEIHDALTEREIEVLTLTGQGLTNKAIGLQLGISARTVQGHLARIYGKLDVNSRTEAVMRAVALGLIPATLE